MTSTPAQGPFGPDFAALADYTADVLFGGVWQRPGLAPRDRSLITVAVLVALNRTEQLPHHLALARTNGVTRAELVEVVTHLAFYAGWPAAASAATRVDALVEA